MSFVQVEKINSFVFQKLFGFYILSPWVDMDYFTNHLVSYLLYRMYHNIYYTVDQSVLILSFIYFFLVLFLTIRA